MKSILRGNGLAARAHEIRQRHLENFCTCPCDGSCGDPDPKRNLTLTMDARERKWAAGKLLRPTWADEEEFTQAEQLEIAQEVWRLRTGAEPSEKGSSLEKARRTARQFHQTTAFARRCWGLEASEPVPGEADQKD